MHLFDLLVLLKKQEGNFKFGSILYESHTKFSEAL